MIQTKNHVARRTGQEPGVVVTADGPAGVLRGFATLRQPGAARAVEMMKRFFLSK